jgi:GGDEF domain-containing protein
MSFLRFITVDMLCIAAEITAALLLLAFAIPEKKKIAQPDANSEELDRLSSQAKQYCVDAAVFRGLAILRDPAKASFHDTEELAENLRLVGYEDKLTHTANHAFADAFLSKWLRLPIEHRTGSSLAMIVVDDYSDLLRAKGAMELEAILRRLSEMIKADFGSNSFISRYQPDRFLIVSFNGDIGDAYTELIALRKKICEIAPDESTGHGAFDCTNSIVHLGEEEVDLSQAIEDLDEGISQASGVADKCVAKSANQEWSDSAPTTSSARDHDTSREADKQIGHSRSPSSTPTSSSSIEKGSKQDIGTAEEPNETGNNAGNGSSVPTAPEKVVADAPVAKETKPQSDVQAVAKNEDIEALFAQINKNKKSNASATEAPAEPSPQTPALETPPVSESDASESATADDIAALFATVKSATQPSSPKPSETPTPKPAPDAIEDENGTASADDIAALFASAQAAPKAPQVPVKAPATTTPVPATPSQPTALENLDEAASADDIAALFASVQSAPKAQQAPAKVPVATTPAPTPAAPSTALENLDEAASADDIAALFASVQSAPKAQQATVTAPAKTTPAPTPPIPSAALENLDEAASADDITSLFAMAKSGKQEAKPPVQPTAVPTPVSTPSNAAKPASEDLSESASANDIAALFAAAKKPTSSSNATGETADKSNPPPVHETPEGKKNIEALVQNLNESASADEIEALFANLK